MILNATDKPGLWVNPSWQDGQPGTFAVVIGVSHYDHLNEGREPAAETYGLGQLHVSALTAYLFFQWLHESYSISGCPLAKCWLLLSPTADERQCLPGVDDHLLRPTFMACAEAVGEWDAAMRALPGASARQSRALFFFSGHGLEPYPQEQLLLPCDYLKPPLCSVNFALSVANLHAGLAPVPVAYQFFFTDACRNDSVGPQGGRLEGTSILNLTANWRAADRRITAPIFYGSASGWSAWQPDHPTKGPTLFGKALLEGLRAQANFRLDCNASTCAVNVSPLAKFLRGRIAELLQGLGASVNQPVQLGGNAMDETVTEVSVAGLATPRPTRPTAAEVELRKFSEIAAPEEAFARNPFLGEVWQRARVVQLEAPGRPSSLAYQACVIHRAEYDKKGSTCRIVFSVNRGGSHWFELRGKDSQKFACLLPADAQGSPRFLLEMGTEEFGAGGTPVRLSYCGIRLAPDNVGLLGHAALAWEAFRTKSLTEAVAVLPDDFLQEALHGGAPSPLAATLAGIILLHARGHSRRDALLGDWLRELSLWPSNRVDGLILYNEQRLQASGTSVALAGATDRLLKVETSDLVCTAETLGYALRQTRDLLHFGSPNAEERSQLETLRQRLGSVLRFYRGGDPFCVFAGAEAALRPEWILAAPVPVSVGAEEEFSLARFIERTFQNVLGSVRNLLAAVAYRLEPLMAGWVSLPRYPRGIHATRVGVFEEISWVAVRPNTGHPVVVRWTSGDPLAAPAAVEVRPEGSRWRVVVRAHQLPLEGLWRGFYLVAEGSDPADDPDRELVFLRRDPQPDRPIDLLHPVELVEQGFLLDGWELALRRHFTEPEMLALLALIWPEMQVLLEEAIATQPEEVQEDLAFWENQVDARQQSVREMCERLQKR